MIFTPEERKALLALAALLLLGQAIALWDRHVQSKPDRELSAWLNRLAVARADSLRPGDRPDSFPAPDDAGTASPAAAPVPVEPDSAIPPGLLTGGRLRINEADAAELEGLPGIGSGLAARIVADREAEGPFRSPRDLLRVRGIGPKVLQRISGRIDCATGRLAVPPDSGRPAGTERRPAGTG